MVRTMTLSEIEGYRGQGRGQQAGKSLRYFCPLHGGDRQRSFKLDPETGHFKCFRCHEWGYLKEKHEEHRKAWIEEQRQAGTLQGASRSERPRPIEVRPDFPDPTPNPDFERIQVALEAAMPGSLGARYLSRRGICPEMALRRLGVGYAPDGAWPHKNAERKIRQWPMGRVTFPHSNPHGDVVNLYGRAVGREVPKEARHDHLPGPRGIFNAAALVGDQTGTVFVCEGPFDALSLIMAGYEFTAAIFGTDGLRWNWVKARRVVLCLDQDEAGEHWKALAYEGTVRGKEVFWLPADVYHGHKDLNEVWLAKGAIDLPDWERSTAPIPKPELAWPPKPVDRDLEALLATLRKTPINVGGKMVEHDVELGDITRRIHYRRRGQGGEAKGVQQLSPEERFRLIRPVTEGRVFVRADYGQADPRVAHAILKTKGLIDWDAGADLYQTLLGEVGSDRKADKRAVNAFINGGPTPAADGRGKLANFVDALLTYRDELARQAKRTGVVSTLLGNMIPLPAGESNFEGKAVNRVVAGTTSDIFNRAVATIHRLLRGRRLPASVALLLFDEVWLEVASDQVAEVTAIVESEMRAAGRLVGVELPVTVRSQNDQ